jgi:hypothetical protein
LLILLDLKSLLVSLADSDSSETVSSKSEESEVENYYQDIMYGCYESAYGSSSLEGTFH